MDRRQDCPISSVANWDGYECVTSGAKALITRELVRPGNKVLDRWIVEAEVKKEIPEMGIGDSAPQHSIARNVRPGSEREGQM